MIYFYFETSRGDVKRIQYTHITFWLPKRKKLLQHTIYQRVMLYLYTWRCKNALEYDTFIIMSTWTNENGRLGIDQPLDGLNCRFHKLSTHSIRFNYLALLVPQWNISGTIFHGTWWSRVKSWTNSNWHDWSLHCHLHLNLKTKKKHYSLPQST